MSATDTIILTVELASGRFKTSLRIPLEPDDNKESYLESWADLVKTGFRIGATEADVALAPAKKATKP